MFVVRPRCCEQRTRAPIRPAAQAEGKVTLGRPRASHLGFRVEGLGSDSKVHLPRPSSYPLLGPKYPLLGTICPQLRVLEGSGLLRFSLGIQKAQCR